MKLGGVLLGVSMAGNVIAIGLLMAWPRGATGEVGKPVVGAADAGDKGAVSGRSTPPDAATAGRPEAWRTLHSVDLKVFAANLRAAGLSEPLVRAIVRAEVDERYRDREAALMSRRPKVGYWQFDNYKEPLDTKLARLDLKREKARVLLDVIGAEPGADEGGGIPAEKHALARMITEDYDTLIGDIAQSHYTLLLPSERKLVEHLQQEKSRELTGLLTRDELTEYVLQNAEFGEHLKRELRGFAPTEAEFRAIFEARNGTRPAQLMARFNMLSQEGRDSYTAAWKKAEDDIRTALGEDRHRDYLREKDPVLLGVRELVDRVGLPRASGDRVYELRDVITRESTRIGEDTTQSVVARRAALAELGARTRQEIQTLLGAEASAAYFSEADHWLNALEGGHVVQLRGGGTSIRGVIDPVPPVPSNATSPARP